MDTTKIFGASIATSDILTWIQIFAYFSAAIFFLYKVGSGAFIVGLDLSLDTIRRKTNDNNDFLTLKLILKCGENSSVVLKSINFKLTSIEESKEFFYFNNIYRLENDKMGNEIWSENRNEKYRIAAKESTTLSYIVKIDSRKSYTIDLAVMGTRIFFGIPAQWRASCISLPIEDKKLS